MSVCQSQDVKIKKLREQLDREQDGLYEMRNGLVNRKKKDKLLFYVPYATRSPYGIRSSSQIL